MNSTTAVFVRCQEHRCYRRATAEDGLCGPHRAGKARRIANDKARNERYEASHVIALRDQARKNYAVTWRAQHLEESHNPAWVCPLCLKAVQSTVTQSGYQYGLSRAEQDAHTNTHGAAWAEYWEAGLKEE